MLALRMKKAVRNGATLVVADPRHPDNNLKPVSSLGEGYQDLASITSDSSEITLGGVAYTVNVYSSPDLRWKFVGLIETSELLADGKSMATAIAMAGLIIIALCSVLGFTFTGLIVAPIQAASRRLQDIAAGEGDLTQRLDDTRRDEIGSLAKSFNSFTHSIQKIISGCSGIKWER